MDDLTHIGPRLRAVRKARGWTLEDLAQRASISVSTLSRLESGKRGASLELLVPLTRQLGIRLDDLVRTDAPDPRVRRPTIRRDGMVIAPLAPEGSPIEIYRVTFPPSKRMPPPQVHRGDEWIYVVAGSLRLHLGNEVLDLRPGEAVQFDTEIPHAIAAVGSKPAEVISIFNDEGVALHTMTPLENAD